MPKPSNNSMSQQLSWKKKLEQVRLRNLQHQENVGSPVQPRPSTPPTATNTTDGTEQSWQQNLERTRLRNSMLTGGINLPGPGAAAATAGEAPDIGKPLPPMASGGSKPGEKKPSGAKGAISNPKAPSSVETAKVAAQVASGVGMTKLAADEAKKALTAAGKGVFATAGATWQIINKYGPWILFFAFFSIIMEDPFITAPSILFVLWVWVTAAHWLRLKFIRKLNVLELMTLIVASGVYVAVLVLLIIVLSFAACAFDTGCSIEAARVIVVDSLLSWLGL